MKKTLMLCCALCLLAIPLGVAQVFAGTYGTDITIYDQAPYASQVPDQPNEAYETEPGTIQNHQWDLTAFQISNSSLSIIGGYDFKNGYGEQGQPVQRVGDLFIATGFYVPHYGQNSDGTTNNVISGSTNGTTYANSYWGYNYAIKFTFTSAQGGTYAIYTPGDGATDIMHGSAGANAGDVSNPWRIGDGWNPIDSVGSGSFTYLTGQTVPEYNNTGDLFNVIQGISLSFLGDEGLNPFYLHLTYECGNDNLMGLDPGLPPGSNVPIPGSLLLLGSGLAGLSLTCFRRRKQVG